MAEIVGHCEACSPAYPSNRMGKGLCHFVQAIHMGVHRCGQRPQQMRIVSLKAISVANERSRIQGSLGSGAGQSSAAIVQLLH